MKLLLLGVLSIAGFLIVGSQMISARDALTFVEKHKLFHSGYSERDDWASAADSPWIGYFKHPFDEALSGKDKMEYRLSQDEGRCLDVVQYDLLGFLQKHSKLRLVFQKNKEIRRFFEEKVAPLYSRGFKRCRALILLKRYDFFKNHLGVKRIFKLGLMSDLRMNKLSVMDERHQFLALRDIMRLALCDDFKSAQLDILQWQERNFNIQLSENYRYYLMQRLNIRIGKVVFGYRKNMKMQIEKKHLIEEAALEGTIFKLRYILPFWFKSCFDTEPIRL